MTMQELRVFHAVAEHGGIGAAARALGVSQSAVSQRVAALENRHGIRLVERDRAGARLTAIGERLHTITRRLVAAADDAERMLAAASGLHAEVLRLGADAPVHVMPIVARLRRAHPDLTVTLETGNSRELLARVREGTLDAAVAADPGPGTVGVPLGAQDLAVVVGAAHPFRRRKTLALRELADEPLVMREPGSRTREVLEAALRDAGLTPPVALTVTGREAVLAAVASGIGVGVIAENELLDDPRLVMIDLREPTMTVREQLVCRAGRREDPLIRTLFAAADGPGGRSHPGVPVR